MQPTKRDKPVAVIQGEVLAEKYWYSPQGRIAVAGEVLDFPAEVWAYAWDEAAKKGEWKWLPFKFGDAVKRVDAKAKAEKNGAPA